MKARKAGASIFALVLVSVVFFSQGFIISGTVFHWMIFPMAEQVRMGFLP